jgi:hypothetical protein
MPVPAFGFSVGDFVIGIKVLNDVRKAFQDAHGASSIWQGEILYLGLLVSTLKQLQLHATSTPNSAASSLIAKLLQLIDGPLEDLQQTLEKYRAALRPLSTTSKITIGQKTVSFTLKGIAGKVKLLRVQIEQPQHQVELLLSLQQM